MVVEGECSLYGKNGQHTRDIWAIKLVENIFQKVFLNDVHFHQRLLLVQRCELPMNKMK